MGVGYCLINNTKKEIISFNHIPATKAKELAGNPVASAITTWYLLKNSGDDVGFIPDQYNEEEWPFKGVSWKVIAYYSEMTDIIVQELIDNKILIDNGIEVLDEDDPTVYMRKLKNIWMVD